MVNKFNLIHTEPGSSRGWCPGHCPLSSLSRSGYLFNGANMIADNTRLHHPGDNLVCTIMLTSHSSLDFLHNLASTLPTSASS